MTPKKPQLLGINRSTMVQRLKVLGMTEWVVSRSEKLSGGAE